MKRKKVSAWILIGMLLCFWGGCRKDDTPAAISGPEHRTTSVSSGEQAVFRGIKAELPEGVHLCAAVMPYAGEDGIVCLAAELTETEAEDGTVVRGEAYSLVTLDGTGKRRTRRRWTSRRLPPSSAGKSPKTDSPC